MGTSAHLSAISRKGDNCCVFLFAHLRDATLTKGVNSYKKIISPIGENFFPLRITPTEKAGKHETGSYCS